MKPRPQRRAHARRLTLAIGLTVIALAVAAPSATLASPTTKRVNVTNSGAEAAGGWSWGPSISSTGRYVAFTSKAANLAAGATNVWNDVYLRDMKSGKTTWVSLPRSGLGNGDSVAPSVSSTGRFVAFESAATEIIGSDTNGLRDIFIHDRTTKKNRRVSVRSNEKQAWGGDSRRPSISATGRYVAFESDAKNLVKGDTNGKRDIFVRDRKSGKTTRVSLRSDGKQAWGGDSDAAAISANGRYVAFASKATNLVRSDTNGKKDVFVHDRSTGKTRRVSVRSNGNQGNNHSDGPAISADGRFIAFDSLAGNLVKGDTNTEYDVFLRDRNSKKTRRVSIRSDGKQALGSDSWQAAISADGRSIAFMSYATNLFTNDLNGEPDVFLRDRKSGKTRLVSRNRFGAMADNDSRGPDISADGRFVVFRSFASDLVVNDTNNEVDIFRRGSLR
jgi:Tol biopolymer transport system component